MYVSRFSIVLPLGGSVWIQHAGYELGQYCRGDYSRWQQWRN